MKSHGGICGFFVFKKESVTGEYTTNVAYISFTFHIQSEFIAALLFPSSVKKPYSEI